MNTAALIGGLIIVALAARRPREAAALAAMGLAACAVSVALYYRDFLGMVLDMLPRIAHGASRAPSRYPVRPYLEVVVERTRDFFGVVTPVLAAAGFVLLLRDGHTTRPAARVASTEARRWLLLSWLAAYLLLLAGRARVPDVFLHGHETLLATPLFALAAGEALAALAGRPSPRTAGRLAAALLVIFLTVMGFRDQWAALAAQMGNAL
jgi:hypothetical protein